MKKLIIAAIALTGLYACNNTNKSTSSFEITGNLTNTKGESIYLEKLGQQGSNVVDSAIIGEKGDFKMNQYLPSVGFYRLRINASNFAMLVLDSAQKVVITGDARDLGNTYKAEGSPDTKLYSEYNILAQNQKHRTDSLGNIINDSVMKIRVVTKKERLSKEDSLKIVSLSKSLQKPYEEMMKVYDDVLAKKIKENPQSFASIMAVQQLNPESYLDTYRALDKGLTEKYPTNNDVKSFHGMVQQTETTLSRTQAIKVGAEAPELMLPMPNGKDLALSNLRGKVVLIDFWASWCGPCRKELPNVKRCYDKYKSKVFEIYGVSLDKERDAWIEVISKEGLTWPQVSDLKFWESEAVRIYAVQSIPFTVLIDKEGKILATDLRGADLDEKLAEVLK